MKETRRCGSGVSLPRSTNSRVPSSTLSIMAGDQNEVLCVRCKVDESDEEGSSLSIIGDANRFVRIDTSLYSIPLNECTVAWDNVPAMDKVVRAPNGISSGMGSFSCNMQCAAVLDCGRHICGEICHGGDCQPCVLTPSKVTTCPCGATPIKVLLGGKERMSCLDPIPLCNNTCNRTLSCGVHKCVAKCHIGACQPCSNVVQMTCRCGLESTSAICSTGVTTVPTCSNVCKVKHLLTSYDVYPFLTNVCCIFR